MSRHLAILVAAWLSVPLSVAVAASPDPERPPGPDPSSRTEPIAPPVFLFLETPASLEAFWNRFKTPDLVLLRGERYQTMVNSGGPLTAQPQPEPTISRVAIRGKVGPKTAELVVDFDVSLIDAGPRWVALKLDVPAIATVKEAGRDLPVRNGTGTGWETEVTGPGKHAIEVGLAAEVVSNGEERRVELAIPLAATTTLGLVVAEAPTEATLGSHDTIVPVKTPGQPGARFEASITPRSRVEMTWRVPLDPLKVLPPLISAQGEIAIDVTPDSIRSRSRWTVTTVRGTTRELTFSFDSEEALLDLELDNRSLAIDTVVQGNVTTFSIPLTEPLRQGSPPRTVAITTRRKVTPHQTSNLGLKGYLLQNATLQTGALSVTQSGSIWVEGVVGRGLVRIDPANDLPIDLRSRPGTVLGYQFVEQPFDLKLKIEPSPPVLEARARTTLSLTRDMVATETEFSFRSTPGQIFSVRFRIPCDVVLEPLRPDGVVEASNLAIEVPSAGRTSRILSVRLTSRARESGAFAIKLRSRQQGSLETLTSIGLSQPMNVTSLGGRIAIRRALGIVVDPDPKAVGPVGETAFRHAFAPSTNDWSWPPDPSPSLEPTAVWLTYEGLPETLPLSMSLRTRSIRSESSLTARVSRTGIDYRESIHIDVLNGLVSELELEVPREIDRGWEIEGSEIASRELSATAPDGSHRYQLILSKGASRGFDLRVRYRTTFDTPLVASTMLSARFIKLKLFPEVQGVVHFSYESEPGITLSVDHPRETRRLMPTSSPIGRDAKKDRLVATQSTSASLPTYQASAEPLMTLPELVVSRTYLRTFVGSDELRTTARYLLDVHGSEVVIGLPAEARWIEAKVDGRILSDVAAVDGVSRFRLRLPSRSSDPPALLTLDYSIPTRSLTSWTPPRIEEATWQTVYWEVVVPTHLALMGVPSGWSDENHWYWQQYLWMRRPAIASSEVHSWISGPRRAGGEGFDESPLTSNAHCYLFRRTDGLAPIPVTLASRVLLVGLCSGGVGLLGIALVLLRPSYRFMTIPIGLVVFVIAVGWDPNVTFQVTQSGALGVFLGLSAAALQRVVDRRGSRSRRMVDTTGITVSSPQKTTSLVAPVGSDDSTAIRGRRQPSADRIVIGPVSESVRAREVPPSETGLRP